MNDPHDGELDRTVEAPSPRSDSRAAPENAARRSADAPQSTMYDFRPVELAGDDDDGPQAVPAKGDTPPRLSQPGDRYQLQGEIARGGMGAILRARDADLGRELAVKVLLERHADRPEVAQRFIEEAQIGGQLQHPGIVPVYDIGRFGDRPFFAMKLVKGQTLAAILADRADPSDDRPRLLGIALQVSQAMAYAHAKGVIHRDLKPANVMVGSFGEVQVMDWGLAKVLVDRRVGEEAPSGRSREPEQGTIIRTARSGGSPGTTGSETEAGSLLGTPAYMPPEQANGVVATLDRRADVFGLGAILCEILTGRPPYVGRSSEEVRRKACNGDLAEAMTRLEACGAEAELIALTKSCLAAEAIDRPRDAQQVAEALAAYLAGVQQRLEEAQRGRAVAVAKAIEERRRRKVLAALAASLVALITLGGASAAYFHEQRVQRAAAVDRLVSQAEALRNQAAAKPDVVAGWQVALAAIEQAEAAADQDAGKRIGALRRELQAGLDAAVRDKTLLDRLLEIRSAKADDSGSSAADLEYAGALAEAGIDLSALPEKEAGARIISRPPAVASAIAAALDDWATVRRRELKDGAGAARLSRIANIVDPDPWRVALRSALNNPDVAARRNKLEELATNADYDKLGPVSLYLLGAGLHEVQGVSRHPAVGQAESVLRKAHLRHPHDVYINYELGTLMMRQGRYDDAIRFYTAARAIRPETAHELAHVLEARGNIDEATAVFEDLRKLRPKNPRHLVCLGKSLSAAQRPEEAKDAIQAAVAACREAIRERPGDAVGHEMLARALEEAGDLDEAVAEFREAIRLHPRFAEAHLNLSSVFSNRKQDYPAAEAVLREMIRVLPSVANGHFDLGIALHNQHKPKEAIACYKRALELGKRDAKLFNNLGVAQSSLEDWEGAIASLRTAIELNPGHVDAHTNLGAALADSGRWDEAIPIFRRAIELAPSAPDLHHNLALALGAQGRVEESIAAFEKEVELEPRDAFAHSGLGIALLQARRVDEAIERFRAAIELDSNTGKHHYGLGLALLEKGMTDEAIESLEKAVALEGADFDARIGLARALWSAGKHERAVDAEMAALTVNPADTLHALRVAALQVWFAKNDDHAATSRRMLDWARDTQNPLDADRVAKLVCLRAVDDSNVVQEAVELARRAVALGKDQSLLPYFQMALGMAEYRSGRFAEADSALQAAAELGAGIYHVRVASDLYRAMAAHQRGESELARTLLAEASQKMHPLPENEQAPFAGGRHHDDLIVWLTFREARALLGEQPHTTNGP